MQQPSHRIHAQEHVVLTASSKKVALEARIVPAPPQEQQHQECPSKVVVKKEGDIKKKEVTATSDKRVVPKAKPAKKQAVAPPPHAKKQVAAQSGASSAQQQALTALVEQSLHRLDAKQGGQSKKVGSRSSIGPLQCESSQATYVDELVSFLEEHLIFPEMGDVDIEVEVTRSGKVVKCTILQSLSAANRAYVSRMLPTLALPPLDNQGIEKKSFRLTLIAQNCR